MAEVDVKKSSTQNLTDTQSRRTSKGLQRQEKGTDVSRSRGWDPFGFLFDSSGLVLGKPILINETDE